MVNTYLKYKINHTNINRVIYIYLITLIFMNSKGDYLNNHPFQCIKQQRNNFGEAHYKQRSSSTQNMIQLSQYFAKRNTNPNNAYYPNQQKSKEKQLQRSPHSMKLLPHLETHKQNVCPNAKNTSHLNSKRKQMGAGKSNHKKVITIRSNIKNSKNKKSFDRSFNGFSTEKRSITESMGYETQIKAFDTEQNHGEEINGYSSCQHPEQYAPNNKKDRSPQKSPPVIQVDLYKHRKSIQGTLVSSNAMTLESIGSNHQKLQQNRRSCGDNKGQPETQPIEQQPLCSNYHQRIKAAIFLVKGKPYCEKCAAAFITNGQLAVRIRSTDLVSQRNTFEDYDNEEKNRTSNLSAFIENLDMIEPRLEDLQEAVINDTVPIIYQQYSKYYLEINQWKQEAVQAINRRHSSLMEDLTQSHNQILQNLELIKTKIEEELKKLKFMRNDIIQNINFILKPHIVSSNKFTEVLRQFEDDLSLITMAQEQIESTKVSIPTISKWSKSKLHEILDQAVFIKYEMKKQQYLFELKCESQEGRSVAFKTKQLSQGSEDLDNPHRLSFGKQLEIYEHKENAQSPTFKMI